MDIQNWLEAMKSPSTMTPLEIKNAYMEMSAYYAKVTAELADTTAELNVIRAGMLNDEDIPHNKAEAHALATDTGVRYVKLKGREKAIVEVIRSLKKAQQYYENEARNMY